MAPAETLTPLLCPACRAPTPLADGLETTCLFCGAAVPIPPDYQALHAARVEFTAQASRAKALFAVLGKPPALLYRSLAGWFSPVALAIGMFPFSFIVGVVLVYGALWLASWVVPINLVDVVPPGLGFWGSVGAGLVFVWSGTLLGVAGTRRWAGPSSRWRPRGGPSRSGCQASAG
jgi:hypothetical protein